jgi:SAM-dependent methyltransferase
MERSFKQMTRTELINYIIKKQGYKLYLEIGIGTGRNFKAIDAQYKTAVDPDPACKIVFNITSDEFFHVQKSVYNIIFIDGLHHADQVRKDIINAWECLTDGGCLVLHDTNPDREEITHVPRDSKEWCGDVYKAIHQIDGPPKFTLKDDHGVTVIRKTGPLVMSDGVIEWEGFEMFREVILHLVTAEEAIKIIDGWK